MNYYKARQRQSDLKWDYTCQNDDRVCPVGYCHKYKEWTQEEMKRFGLVSSDLEKSAKDKDKYHTHGHDTQEEAEACYREFLLDQELSLNHKDTNTQRKCEVCGEWTQGLAYLDMRVFNLCDKHMNRESVATLFKEVGEIWSS